MTDLITLQQVQDLAYEIAQEQPDAVNPMVHSLCQYDLDGRHCYVGEIFTRLGIRLPAEGDEPRATPDAVRFGDGALDWLQDLQSNADYIDEEGNLTAWGDAYERSPG